MRAWMAKPQQQLVQDQYQYSGIALKTFMQGVSGDQGKQENEDEKEKKEKDRDSGGKGKMR